MSKIDAKTEFLDIVKSVRAYIEAEKTCGINEMLMPNAGALRAEKKKQALRPELLSALRNEVLNCKSCGLYKTRRNVVFGDGDSNAKLLFVGEAPGFDEDLQGLPFVGQAGKLLTKMIESIGLSRDSVYICNVLKCRPPGNRSPLPEEISVCREYLSKQIEIITPKVICCLGKYAAQVLLGTEESITNIRGKGYNHKGIHLIPTFHPAYLLRNPNSKRLVWEDLKRIKRILSEV